MEVPYERIKGRVAARPFFHYLMEVPFRIYDYNISN